MPLSAISEAVAVLEEVSSGTGEAVVPVDLSTVSQQLVDIQDSLLYISFGQLVLCGVLLGVAITLVLAVMFRG